MKTREEVLRSPYYWFEHVQNEIFREVTEYMEKENIDRTELGNRLNLSKREISRILNGNINCSLKKWVILCLKIGIVPDGYKNIDYIIGIAIQNLNLRMDANSKIIEHV